MVAPTERDAFAGFHPVVNLFYFVAVIGFAMVFLHPVALSSSLFCAVIYAITLKGIKALRFGLLFLLPLLVFTAALNPLFNHQGVTILAYLPNGNPLTMESVLYGVAAAGMLVTVIIWFTCFNAVMTSDKFIYLFGRAIPALSLVLSMALRFVPRFIRQIKVIANAQRGLGYGESGGLPEKVKRGVKILSILVTWALENAVETADSMKGRGYGLPGRSAFSVFAFKRRDFFALSYLLACLATVLAGSATGAYRFRFFPSVQGQWVSGYSAIFFTVYFFMGIFPVILNINEALQWKRIASTA
jgi:energy-coupling factor transport system permease protein